MFSLPTAPQFLRADRHGQPLFVAFSPALISAISAFISTISALGAVNIYAQIYLQAPAEWS